MSVKFHSQKLSLWMLMNLYKILLSLTFLLSFCGCSTLNDPQERYLATKTLALAHSWKEKNIDTGQFILKTFESPNQTDNSELLTVFIEGDGFSWFNRYTPSDNPTPKNPLALKIALNLNLDNSTYLSRPCQNVFQNDFKNCSESLWTTNRFDQTIIHSMDIGLSEIKKAYHVKKIKLVGYSGGGVISLLLAAKRDDVVEVITIASNIDTDTWTEYHNLTSLNSENPALIEKLHKIPQTHFSGSEDSVVPPEIAKSYISRYPLNHLPMLHIINGFDHACCWEQTAKYWKR